MTGPGTAAVYDATSELVAAYVIHNPIGVDELSALIVSVHTTLRDLIRPKAPPSRPVTARNAAAIRTSVTDDYLVSFEDGKRYKTLKRHIRSFGLTPDQYRVKWGLSPDYPMIAPAYAAQQRRGAKGRGFGRRTGAPA